MDSKSLIAASLLAGACSPAVLADTCEQLPRYAALQTVLRSVVPQADTPNGGLGFPMWLTLVDGAGRVCAVTTSLPRGGDVTSEIWLGSRVISAQKANTANSFSNGSLSLSTANLYAPVQPGGSLFGLQESNPVDATVAYDGPTGAYGQPSDPLVGKRIGGINVFGGGLTLYRAGKKIGALGVSGDTSCTDHVVAWKVRHELGLDGVPPSGPFDHMIQDLDTPRPSGFGHPTCLNNPTAAEDGGSIVR
jgi:uncharacterized protein GlcG (DUF336 family)